MVAHVKENQIFKVPDFTKTLIWCRQDTFFILVTTVLCVACFYQPLREAGGGVLILFLALFSMLNPFSAALFLAASQTLTDSPGLAFTPAQLSAAGFALALFFHNRLSTFPEVLSECLRWMGPFLLIVGLKRIFIWNSLPFPQYELLALSACLMTAIYYREGAKNKWLWLFCLCLGAIIGISGFVLYIAGFEATVQAGAHGVRERLYIGRASNATSIGLVAGLGGMLSLWLAVRMRTLRIVPERREWWVNLIMLLLCWLAVLSVFATGSRAGSLGALTVIGVALVTALFLPKESQSQTTRKRIIPAILVLIVAATVAVTLPQTGFMSSVQRMLDFNRAQAQLEGTNLLVAGRSEAWVPAFLDFLDSPIMGVMPGQSQRTYYDSHNVFISIGKGFGLVGLLAYLIYFVGPTVRVCRTIGLRLALPFVLFLLGIFLIFNSLNFPNYKTFHVYNGILIGLILGQQKDKGRSSSSTR